MHGMVHDLVKYLPGVLNRCEKEPCVPFFYDRFLLLVQEGYIDYLDCFVSFLLVPPAMYFRLFFFSMYRTHFWGLHWTLIWSPNTRDVQSSSALCGVRRRSAISLQLAGATPSQYHSVPRPNGP